jgi:hypothetical protein
LTVEHAPLPLSSTLGDFAADGPAVPKGYW